MNNVYRPTLLSPCDPAVGALRASGAVWSEHDLLADQLEEWLDARLLGRDDPPAREALRAEALAGADPSEFGVWVHYPWSGVLARVLPAPLFRALRFDRNRDKITAEEQARLGAARVGIVGLSVGNAVATTLAQEGVGGALVLADFDRLSTSNLNRVRAPIHVVGQRKTVVAARQIAEIDPFVEVICHHEGLTEANLPAFLDGLDVLVDECDGVLMKLRLREAARERGLPVVMETSDRGLLDVERFDLEPQRPIFHGAVPPLAPDQAAALSAGARLDLVAQILGDGLSTRAAASMLEIGATLSTWPQLASDVALGGATVCAAVRRIVLGQPLSSGRRRVDLAAILSAPEEAPPLVAVVGPPAEVALPDGPRRWLEAAIGAPSGGNCQPWSFQVHEGEIRAFHERDRSRSLLDVDGHAGLLSVGAAIEGARLAASEDRVALEVRPTGALDGHVATLRPTGEAEPEPLAAWLDARFTDRRTPARRPLTAGDAAAFAAAVGDAASLDWVTDPAPLAALGEALAEVDRVRLLHPDLHREMWEEVRWTEAEALARPDGMQRAEMIDAPGDAAVLSLLRRPDVVAFLRQQGKGARLGDKTRAWARSAGAVGLLWARDLRPAALLEAGAAMHRLWLTASARGWSLQPIGVAAYLVRHLGTPLEAGYRAEDLEVLRAAERALSESFSAPPSARLLLFRVLDGGERYAPRLRRPLAAALRRV